MAKKELNAAISSAVKEKFDLNKFKKAKNLTSANFKPQEWIPVTPALQEVLSIQGIPHGHITILRGHTDSGKSTLLVDIAKNCQKKKILPVFIITEMKWNWRHVLDLGFEADVTKDDDGNETHDGFFIYVDRSTLHTIEDVAAFIMGLLEDQKKGNLPYDLCFLWDSVGSINCKLGIESKSFNNEWCAGAISREFGNMVNQQLVMSRKQGMPYTNSLVVVNKVWTAKAANSFSQPKMMNKGGMTLWYDASLVITFGNVANSGSAKLKAVKAKKSVEFAKISNVQIDKFHANETIYSKGNIVMTQHGFIANDPKAIEKYKKEHSDEWLQALGATSSDDFTVVEEADDSKEVYEDYDGQQVSNPNNTLKNILSDL